MLHFECKFWVANTASLALNPFLGIRWIVQDDNMVHLKWATRGAYANAKWLSDDVVSIELRTAFTCK